MYSILERKKFSEPEILKIRSSPRVHTFSSRLFKSGMSAVSTLVISYISKYDINYSYYSMSNITNSSPIQGNEAASACLEGIMFSCTTRTTIFPMYSCGQFRISPLFPLMSARRKTSLREETEGQARTMFYLHLHSYLSLEVESHNHIFEIAWYRVAIYVACQNLIYSCAYSCSRLLA